MHKQVKYESWTVYGSNNNTIFTDFCIALTENWEQQGIFRLRWNSAGTSAKDVPSSQMIILLGEIFKCVQLCVSNWMHQNTQSGKQTRAKTLEKYSMNLCKHLIAARSIRNWIFRLPRPAERKGAGFIFSSEQAAFLIW